MKHCSEPGCDRPVRARGLCRTHYRRGPGPIADWTPRPGWDRRAHQLHSLYGITPEQEAALPRACQICGKEDDLVIDHCHGCQKVRGRLCRQCNAALGLLQEDAGLIERAFKYILEDH